MDSFLYLHKLEAINCLVTAVLLINTSELLASFKSISSSTIRCIGLAIVNAISTYLLFAGLMKALGPIPNAVPISLGFAMILTVLLHILTKIAWRLNFNFGYKVISVASSFSLFLLQGPFSALHIIIFMAVWLLIGLMIDWHKYSQQLKAVQ